jgi:hypothetical protein
MIQAGFVGPQKVKDGAILFGLLLIAYYQGPVPSSRGKTAFPEGIVPMFERAKILHPLQKCPNDSILGEAADLSPGAELTRMS